MVDITIVVVVVVVVYGGGGVGRCFDAILVLIQAAVRLVFVVAHGDDGFIVRWFVVRRVWIETCFLVGRSGPQGQLPCPVCWQSVLGPACKTKRQAFFFCCGWRESKHFSVIAHEAQHSHFPPWRQDGTYN